MIRAPVTLSREVKILLTAIGLVALLGGWLVWSNQKQGQQAAVTPPVVTASPQTQTNKAPPSASQNDKAGSVAGQPADSGKVPTAVVAVAPALGSNLTVTDGKTEVATVPPFPVTDPNGSTPDPAVLTPTPSGINPDQPLNGLNGHNPFKSLKVDNAASAVTARAPSTQAPQAQVTEPVTIQQPRSTQAQINSALGQGGGALPLPQIPTTQVVGAASGRPHSDQPNSGSPSPKPVVVSRSSESGASAGGALPIPQIPGTMSVSGAAPTTTVLVPSGVVHAQAGRNGDVAGGVVSAPAAITPPVAGVQVPPVGVSGPATANQNNANQTGAGQAGNSQNAGGQVTKPTAGNPQVITSLQPDTGAAPAENKVDTAIAEHQLVFDAAVLGPINTAVFRSDNGFVVASVGQPIPDTNLTLKEVTATTVTLTAGNDSKTLQLDKR